MDINKIDQQDPELSNDSKVINFQHLVVIKKFIDLLLLSYQLGQPFFKQFLDNSNNKDGVKNNSIVKNGLTKISNIFQIIEEILKLVPVEETELNFDRIFYEYFKDMSSKKLDLMIQNHGKQEILSRLELYRFYYPHLVDKCDIAISLLSK